MSFIKEFKAFVIRGNVIDLAIGIIIGSVFGKIVSSLVNDILMPIINPLIPGGNWKQIAIGPGIKIGSFFGAVIDFIIIAFTIFLIIKGINKIQRKKEEAPAAPPSPTKEELLLTEIRDILKNK